MSIKKIVMNNSLSKEGVAKHRKRKNTYQDKNICDLR